MSEPIPKLLKRKIYKTGQTRGADDDEIYQNRVLRNNTVLIPYSSWINPFPLPNSEDSFEKGFIVLIRPKDYFEEKNIDSKLQEEGLELGHNALVFYSTREEWEKYNPKAFNWNPAQEREPPLGGQYVARVPGTTSSEDGARIREGFMSSRRKGAGIRVFEYASKETIKKCRLQLEALFWLCDDSTSAATENGMTMKGVVDRKKGLFRSCSKQALLDCEKLFKSRMVNTRYRTICPLCLKEISGFGFFTKVEQAKGREVLDLTVTEVNLFHVKELRVGQYNHRPYNLAWGHHHCNIVTRDLGIDSTLEWMSEVLERNKSAGLF